MFNKKEVMDWIDLSKMKGKTTESSYTTAVRWHSTILSNAQHYYNPFFILIFMCVSWNGVI